MAVEQKPVIPRLVPKEIETAHMAYQIVSDLEWLNDTYGLTLDIKASLDPSEAALISDTVDGRFLQRADFTLPEISGIVGIVRREIPKYPWQFIDFCSPSSLRFYRKIPQDKYDGGAIPAPHYTLFFATGADRLAGLAEGIHHELFHQSEHKEGANSSIDYNSDWSLINSPQGSGYLLDHFDPDLKTPPPPGFARFYGRRNLVEDRATIAELIMMGASNIGQRIVEDLVLSTKISAVMDAYYDRSGGLMDFDYFSKLFAGQLGEGYWQQRLAPLHPQQAVTYLV